MTNYLDILWDAFALFVLWPLPLWIFVGIVIASIVIAWRVGRRGRTGWRKLGIGVSVLLGIFLMCTWDVIAGRIYMNYLCATQAGVKVFKKVYLPAEYWNPDGTPKFMDTKNPREPFDETLFNTRFSYESWRETKLGLNVRQISDLISEKTSGEVLGTRIWFTRGGGWFKHAITFSHSGGGGHVASCFPDNSKTNDGFLKFILLPEQSHK